MDNVKINEEIRYCTSCGAVNKKSAVRCSSCEEKMVARHSPFMSFLIKRIKSKAFGEGKERIFKLIRRYLYEHLYGVILTVSVVTTGTIVLANPQPSYIKTVTEFPKAVALKAEDEAPKEIELTDRDHMWIHCFLC